jgi:uncharacterized protein DUF1841
MLGLMPFTVDKAELDRYASGLGREVAADLDSALGWLGAHEDGPSVEISRHDLQQFVHYTLPRKYLADVEEHIAVARALGDALERLGAPPEYADLCRSPETIAVLRLWAVDEDAAFARFAALTDASGLEPPDVEELEWQGVMGLAEARTREAATLALERAVETGDTRPAADIVRAVLAEPDSDGEHPTRLLAVQAERIDRWAGWRSSPRRALLEPLAGDLLDARLPEWPADDVLDWLLDEARSGLALTERGSLSRAICDEIARRRPAWTWGKPPRSESDIDNLRSLHAALRASGLVRRRGRKLLATRRAGDLTPGARRARILESLLHGDSFLAAVAELTLAALAQGVPDAGVRVAEAIDDAGWRSDGGPLPSYAVPSAMTDVRRVLLAIGAAEGEALSREECVLTGPGRAAVLCALRAQALRPSPLAPAPLEPPPPPDPLLERAGVALPAVPGGAPPHLRPGDADDRAELIRLAHPELAAAIDAGEEVVAIGGDVVNPRLHLLMHQVVAERLLHDDPPEDWFAFQAVLDAGVDAHEAQHAIGRRFVEELMAQLGPPTGQQARPAARTRVRGGGRERERRKAQRAARRRNRR